MDKAARAIFAGANQVIAQHLAKARQGTPTKAYAALTAEDAAIFEGLAYLDDCYTNVTTVRATLNLARIGLMPYGITRSRLTRIYAHFDAERARKRLWAWAAASLFATQGPNSKPDHCRYFAGGDDHA